MNMLNNNHVNLIVTIKNRVQHFIQTFPSLVTQYGASYDIILVDFGSNDNFLEKLKEEIECRNVMFSPYLKNIICISKLDDVKFNPRCAKNLGAFCAVNCESKGNIFAFSDVDTFLGMDYISYWSNKITPSKSFFVTRQQESMASLPRRLSPEINYGNIIVYKSDFLEVNGWDESVSHYGGDDDDLFHRLKLKGLREINPVLPVDAKQYSILHGDELRTQYMSVVNRVDQGDSFSAIYGNKDCKRSICDHLVSPKEFKIHNYFRA